jgi:2Fe-2S ferredoxin
MADGTPEKEKGFDPERPPAQSSGAMAKVRFLPSGFELDVAPGTELVDVCDEHPETEVPFSCRSASCGTCRCFVREGAEHLSKAEDDELDVLEVFGDGDDVRLCCQAKLVGDGPVTLEVVEPE